MKTTVYRDEFHNYFMRSDTYKNQFSRDALNILYDYFDEYEESTGESIEFDLIAICCEYAESDIQELIIDYGYMMDSEAEKTPEYIREFLSDHCQICGEYENESGHTVFVYSQF